MGTFQYIVNLLTHALARTLSAIPRKSVTLAAPPPLHALALDYAFFQKHMMSLIPSHLPLALREPRTLATIGACAAATVGIAAYFLTRNRPSAEDLERERRDLLARTGRITDGTIMDTMVEEAGRAASASPDEPAAAEDAGPTPNIIIYNYRIAGVTYECAQDVTALASYVRGIRSDLPIQVRYAPRNPGNSIVVADSWSGLRLTSAHTHLPEPAHASSHE